MQSEIRHVSLRSLAVTGAAAGLVFSCLPALCLGSMILGLVNRAADMLESWRSFLVQLPDLEAFGLPIELPDIPIDLVQQLGLEGLEEVVLALAGGGVLLLALLVLGGMLLGALFMALFALVWGALFNLLAPRMGGLAVELQPDPGDRLTGDG